jgi:S-(hydroxymethyl)glutathione dehydrogenase/alcohol dehydrogenase
VKSGAPRSSRGAVFRAPRAPLVVEELTLDEPAAGEVAVAMRASGICHSDLHVADGEWERPRGLVLGHEGSAVVEALGEGVAERFPDLREGALVVLAWTAPCGRCDACHRSEAWLCRDPIGGDHRLAPDLVRLHGPDGSPVGAYCGIGTFGERQVVAAEAAIPVDPRTPVEVAALIGCAVATGVGAVLRTAGVRARESVAIVGAGGVGLSALLGALVAEADPIVVFDAEPAKLELARSLGATDAIALDPADPSGQPLPLGRFDHAFECVGLAATCELTVDLARAGGTATFVGMTPQGIRAGIDVYRFVEDGKRLLGSSYGSSVPAEAFPVLAGLHLAGTLPVERLISETIPLEAVNAALDGMRRRDGARRVILHR